MNIGVLGPLSHDGSVGFGRRDRAILTALAMRVGQTVSVDSLTEAVWGRDPPPSSHKALQGCVVRLRRSMGAGAIETSAQGYRLVIPAFEVDFQRFEQMVGRSREMLELGEPERAAYLLTQALQLWRGRAFEDVEPWDRAAIEASRLDELRLEAEELRVDAYLRSGRHLDVLATAESMVRAAPMRERRWMLLSVAQYQAGRQTEALRTLHRLKAVLAERLGLDPGPELASLEEAILRQDAALLSNGVTPTSARCPYQGLMPYDVGDAESFFGRDADVRACLELLASSNTLAVLGPSGSGKSSLVRAGVAASLTRDSHVVQVMTPGRHPLHSLSAVSEPAPGSVLLVDQCEEAFALCGDEPERKAFFAALVARAETEPLVLAMRADRLADASAYPDFARLLERGLHLLGAMVEEGLRDAVQAPARQSGLLIEAGLVDLLVAEVQGIPGALPMLSHALQETWKRREGNTLTVAGYTATGGIRRAVAKSAEDVYANIAPEHRPMLRDLLLRLVTAGAEGEPVRSRVPRRLLSADADHEHLIDLLVASRLVTSDSGVVEIAHEALARAWPRLTAWLDDDVEGQRVLHHLTGSADAWDAMGRPDSELYRGVRATRALEWKANHDTALTGTEVAFLEATERNEWSEQRASAERSRTQARLIRRLRGVLAVAMVLLLTAAGAGLIAAQQRNKAQSSAAAALAAKTVAEARRAGALALTTDDIEMSMLLAVAGVRLDDSPETRSSLLAAVQQHPELIASTPMAGSDVVSLDVSPDGLTAATYDLGNRVRLYDIGSGALLHEFQTGAAAPLSFLSQRVRFSPDGETLAVNMTAPTRQPVTLLDADTFERLAVQPGAPRRGPWLVLDVAYSGGGTRVAATMWRVRVQGDSTEIAEGTWAFVWDLRTLDRPTAAIRLKDGNPGVALSPDGNVLYTTDPLAIHDLAAGTSVPVANPGQLGRLAVSPDGRTLATPDQRRLLLLDAGTGEVLRRLPGNDDVGFIVNFSADGHRVATVTYDKREALVWGLPSGRLLARLPLGESGEAIDFGPDGASIFTAGSSGPLRHWDIDGQDRFIAEAAFVPPRSTGNDLGQPAPGGKYVTYPDHSTGIRFFDVETGTFGESLAIPQGYRRGGGTWHPDGNRFALVAGGEVRIWDARTNALVRRGRPSGPEVSAVDYSTDGSRLVIGELSGRVTMLDPATLEPVGRPVILDDAVCCLAAGPNNHTAVALTGDFTASGFWYAASTRWWLVDLDDGAVVADGPLSIKGRAVAVSPDGRHATIGSQDGDVMVLDLLTGQQVGPPRVSPHESSTSATYSTDGQRFLTSGADSVVGLWDAATGLPIARIVTPGRYVDAVFSTDDETVIVAPLWGGPIYEWDTRVDTAIAYACRVAGREMTRAEWTQQFGDRPYQEVCA
jgi:WD40 repeat protein/DNA-binding SARP family transcriptional activator